MRKLESPDYFKIFKYSPSLKIIKLLSVQSDDKLFMSAVDIQNKLGKIVRTGNFEIIKYFLNKCFESFSYSYNQMHRAAILQGDEAKKVKGI